MSNSDCASIWIYSRIIICDSKMIQESNNLYCKCFIDLKGTNIFNC